jgi:hypothetical protein
MAVVKSSIVRLFLMVLLIIIYAAFLPCYLAVSAFYV